MSSLIPPASPPQTLSNSPLDDIVGPRKMTKQMREIFRETLDQLGGAAWLLQFVQSDNTNARVFVQALSKFIAPTVEPVKPAERQPVVLDIPWITQRRLAYKDREIEDATLVPTESGRFDADVDDIISRDPMLDWKRKRDGSDV